MSDGSDGSPDDNHNVSVSHDMNTVNKLYSQWRVVYKVRSMNTAAGVNRLIQPLLASLNMISVVIMIRVVIN